MESQGAAAARSYFIRMSPSSSATFFSSETSSRTLLYPRTSPKVTIKCSPSEAAVSWVDWALA